MRVFVNGVFDVLHVGHINLLMYARYIAGDKGKLVVAIDADVKVTADKGLDRPVFNEHERAKAILDLRLPNGSPLVDWIEFFETDKGLEELIDRIKPAIIVKGDDWKGRRIIGAGRARIHFYARIDQYSSTNIIERCQKSVSTQQ